MWPCAGAASAPGTGGPAPLWLDCSDQTTDELQCGSVQAQLQPLEPEGQHYSPRGAPMAPLPMRDMPPEPHREMNGPRSAPGGAHRDSRGPSRDPQRELPRDAPRDAPRDGPRGRSQQEGHARGPPRRQVSQVGLRKQGMCSFKATACLEGKLAKGAQQHASLLRIVRMGRSQCKSFSILPCPALPPRCGTLL